MAIVKGSFFLVGEHIVGTLDFLESTLGCLVARVDVGMELGASPR